MKAWLKGGLIGAVLVVILYFLFRIYEVASFFGLGIIPDLWRYFSQIEQLSFWFKFIIYGFIVGSVFGPIISKIKNSTERDGLKGLKKGIAYGILIDFLIISMQIVQKYWDHQASYYKFSSLIYYLFFMALGFPILLSLIIIISTFIGWRLGKAKETRNNTQGKFLGAIIFIIAILLLINFGLFGIRYYLIQPTNLQDCLQISNIAERDSCYIKAPNYSNDVLICDAITSAPLKKGCYVDTARKTKDISMCSHIEDYITRDYSCYGEIAALTKNASICELINDSTRVNSCYSGIAVWNTDLSFCEKITSGDSQKEGCIKIVESNLNAK